MALSFFFHTDAALTTPVVARLPFVQAVADPVPADRVLYFGSPRSGRICQAASDPGVDPVTIAIADANSGSGSPTGDVRLALTSGGLDTAVGGDPLTLPETIAGGVAGAVAVHVRVLDSTHASGVNRDLTLVTNTLREVNA